MQSCLGAGGCGEGCKGLHEPSQEERQAALGQVDMGKNCTDSLFLVQNISHHISCSGIYVTVVSSKPGTGFEPWTFLQTWAGINAVKTGIPTSKLATHHM